MTLKENLHINGYFLKNFDDSQSVDRLDGVIDNILSGNLKSGFSLKEKYKNSLDLRPNVFSHDEAFIDVLFDNNIDKLINEVIGINLYLSHIQLRIAYPSSGNGSYTGWHRDTHFYNNHDIVGNIPPVYKLIYYPMLSDKETPQLKIIDGSHNFIFNHRVVDKLYAKLAKSITISSSKGRFLFFNTSMYHRAVNSIIDHGSPRLIYSFVREEQLKEYSTEEDLHELYKKRLIR
jgi:hypothetical protein